MDARARELYDLLIEKYSFLQVVLNDEAKFINEESFEELNLLLDRKDAYLQHAQGLEDEVRVFEKTSLASAKTKSLAEADAAMSEARSNLDALLEHLAVLQEANRTALQSKLASLEGDASDMAEAKRRAVAYANFGE